MCGVCRLRLPARLSDWTVSPPVLFATCGAKQACYRATQARERGLCLIPCVIRRALVSEHVCPPSNFSCVVRDYLAVRHPRGIIRRMLPPNIARRLAGDRLGATPVSPLPAYALVGVVCCWARFAPLSQRYVRRVSTHCSNMVVVVVVVVVVPRARVFSLCLVSQLHRSWYPQYSWRPARLLSRVCARLTDPASLRCNDQVLAAEDEQEQQQEEEAAVVSLSGCALPFARCCVVTSHPARAFTRCV